MKKIAVIIERADVRLGGAERSLFELVEALNEAGNETHILAARGEAGENIHILCGGTAKRVTLGEFADAIKSHLRKNRYDIVHSFLPLDFADIYQPRGGSYAEAAIRNAASYENKAVGWFKRVTSSFNRRRTEMLWAERTLCKKQDGPVVAALSDYVAGQFEKHYGLGVDRVKVIRNGVKCGMEVNLEKVKQFRSQVIDRFAEEKSEPVLFLFAANNFRLKGLRPLICALKIALDSKPERLPVLLAAGSGSANKYQRLAERLGIAERVIFLGPLNSIHVAAAASDAAVLPTFYDPSSRFILEAMAAGVPVITTSYNGASEFLREGSGGYVIREPGDVESLAKAILSFTRTENLARLKAGLDDELLERISISKAAKELDTLYNNIIEKRKH